jgi:hypothetical protein
LILNRCETVLAVRLGGDMATNRKRQAHGRVELNGLMRFHIETGDCLIAGPGKGCGCGLRDYEGNERADLVRLMKARMEAEKHGN